MIDIDSILQTQTYHIFYKNKLLKQLSSPIPKKIDQLIKENVNPPKTNKKVFLIRIKSNLSNLSNSKSKLIISCSQQTITSKLEFTAEKGDYFITVKYSQEEFEKYGFKLSHIKKIIKALETRKISLEKNCISISEILK
jgi:hypothetical protein